MAEDPRQQMLKALGRETYGFPANKVVEDCEGNKLHLSSMDGRTVPPFGEKYLRRIRDMHVRDDDVFLCGYPKTGCHWTWEILRMILAQKDQLTTQGKGQCFLEMAPEEVIESQPSPRVLNTHVWWDYLPKQMLEKKSKIILTCRNPKDTAVSFYNHTKALKDMHSQYDGPFHAWFQLFMEGKVEYDSFVYYHQSWNDSIRDNPSHPIFIARFENMKEDLPREVRAMAKFLEVELTEDQVQAIAKAAGFNNMKEAYKTSSSLKLLRKGQVGDWKNWLTVAQSEAIDSEIDRKLEHTCFRFRYTLGEPRL